MKLFYIDESGTGFKDTASPYFLLSAFSIDANNWFELDKTLSHLKRGIFPYMKSEDFEIKGRDIRRGEKVFKNLPWESRIVILKSIAHVLSLQPCRIFAVSLDKLA